MHLLELAEAIKERRRSLDINQQQLSELTEVGLRTIKGIESGKANPTLKTVTTILNVLGLKLTIKTQK